MKGTLWERAQQVYLQRGYLVFGFLIPHQLGEILTTTQVAEGEVVPLPQPFRIIAETTMADYESQVAMASAKPHPMYAQAYFYKAVTE